MVPYSSVSPITGKLSSIIGYEYGDDYITVYFRAGAKYTYTIQSCGQFHINNMKHLADSKHGLNTYITRNKPQYASKY